MSLAQDLEKRIRQNRLFSIKAEWEDEMIFPFYSGLSLRNVPHSIAELLNAPLPNTTPLDSDVWQGDFPQQSVDRVVAFLMDGMGYKHLHMLAEEDPEIRVLVDDLTDGRGLVPLTSVAPSTTAVALPTLWTGAAPGETGMLGTIMLLREFSTLGDMLSFRPIRGRYLPDTFFEWGMEPSDFIAVPGLSEHLAAQGIESHLVVDYKLAGSGLSRILHRGITKTHLHSGYSDMILRVEDALRQTKGKRCYVGVYWPAVDSVAHLYGAHNRYTKTEIRTQLTALRTLFSDPAIQDGRTVFMILADHGHYDAPDTINLMDDPEAAPIREAMTVGASGDNRLAQLYLRPGTTEQVKAHIDATYGDCLTYIEREQAITSTFFGAEPLASQSHNRIGDLILVPRLGWTVQDPSVAQFPVISWHGGLSDWEMLIPFLWKQG